MSESVIDSGKLIPIKMTQEEAWAECKRLDVDIEFYTDYLEALSDETDEYADIDGLGFCRVENFKTEDPNDSWCTFVKNRDGSYDFRTCYYNGGAHWTELVACEVKRARGWVQVPMRS